MGNKIITEKDFWMCTGGLMPAQLQSVQKTTMKADGTKYITKIDTSTASFADFSCKKLMWVMALLAAIIAVAVVATGGAALIAIAAVAGAAGALLGAAVGALLCGQMVAKIRQWDGAKENFLIQNIPAITGKHTMTCPIFGDRITFAPQVKSWTQALLMGEANLAAGILQGALTGMLVAGAAEALPALMEGGSAALGESGLSGLAKFLGNNLVNNYLATWLTEEGLAIRGAMAASSGLEGYGQKGYVTDDDVENGIFGMENGTAQSARNVFTGNGSIMDCVGLALWFSPVAEKEPNENKNEEQEENNEQENEEGNNNNSSETPAFDDPPPKDGEGNAYEDDGDEIQQGFDDLAAKREEMGLPKAGSETDGSTIAKLKIGENEYYGVNLSDQPTKTNITLDRVNAITQQHAEAEATQKAVNDNQVGKAEEARMWVDRDPCPSCGYPRNGLRSLARNLGVNKLIVYSPGSPDGTIYTPTK